MMRTRALLAALLLGAAPSAQALSAGVTGGATLRRPLGARPIGVADAFSAVGGGLDSLSTNPAGLMGIKRPQIQAVYIHGSVDDRFSYLGYGQKVGPIALSGGVIYYDGGKIGLNLSDGTRRSVQVQRDLAALIGVAIPLPGRLSAGVLAKAYRFELAETASTSGLAVDFGGQWRTPLRNFTVGASLQNIGPEVKYEEEGDPLPTTARAGAAYLLDLAALDYDIGRSMFTNFLFTLDAIKARDERVAAATGVEMLMPMSDMGRLALRLGYIFNRDIDSVTFGLGFHEKRWTLDYGLGVKKVLSNVHHVALGFNF